MAQIDGAVSADEAGTTAAQPRAVTSTTVTARVVDKAVRRSAGFTDVTRRTSAAVSGDQVRARAAITTWVTGTLIFVSLTVLPCVRPPTTNKAPYTVRKLGCEFRLYKM